MVPKDEGNHIALTGATSVTDEFDNWDTAWGGDEEESDQSKNRKSVEEEKLASQLSPSPADDSMADAADAWGWGDDDDTEVVPVSTFLVVFSKLLVPQKVSRYPILVNIFTLLFGRTSLSSPFARLSTNCLLEGI